MHHGIHLVCVEGRMKVENGGRCGVTEPFWSSWCSMASLSVSRGVPSRRRPQCEVIDNGFDEGCPSPHNQLPMKGSVVGGPVDAMLGSCGGQPFCYCAIAAPPAPR